MIPLQPTTPRISGLVILRRMFIALVAVALAAPVTAQNIRDAADSSSVLDNTAKGISNGGVLLTAIPGVSPMALPIKTTGYFGGGGAARGGAEVEGTTPQPSDSTIIGTLGLGNEMMRKCPFVNAHRQETTYTPGQMFTVRNCSIMDGLANQFWVGVRVYGMICSASSPSDCQSLENGLTNPSRYETDGYVALLKPGLECGPEKWPTEELRRAGAPAYAEWCDFGVRVP